MRDSTIHRIFLLLRASSLALICAGVGQVTTRAAAPSAGPARVSAARDVLSPREWARVEAAAMRALGWMAKQQLEDGSFPTLATGKPGVTGLCVLAYLAGGHMPGDGPYGKTIDRGIDYLLSCQQSNGLIARGRLPTKWELHNLGHTAIYNHAIGALALSESYGITDGERAPRIRAAVGRAIRFTLNQQRARKELPHDRGGWRYLRRHDAADSDLSVTGWQIMFLRSAKNAGFEVPSERIDEAVRFVQRCFDGETHHTFLYGLDGRARRPTRAVTGAGILTLSLAGLHHTPEAVMAADTLLEHSFDRYNAPLHWPRCEYASHEVDRYHYGAFYCTQAAFQMGGRYWERLFPPLARVLIEHQAEDGAWAAEAVADQPFGRTYTTALVVLTLATPDQLLPIFQR